MVIRLALFRGMVTTGSQCDRPSTTSYGLRSPTKRFNLHIECINQLSKWYSLLCYKDQYDEMKDTIMEDMKAMKELTMSCTMNAYIYSCMVIKQGRS